MLRDIVGSFAIRHSSWKEHRIHKSTFKNWNVTDSPLMRFYKAQSDSTCLEIWCGLARQDLHTCTFRTGLITPRISPIRPKKSYDIISAFSKVKIKISIKPKCSIKIKWTSIYVHRAGAKLTRSRQFQSSPTHLKVYFRFGPKRDANTQIQSIRHFQLSYQLCSH